MDMVEFEDAVKMYLLAHGAEYVTLRSGRYPLELAPLELISPYLCWQAQIGAKLLVGMECLEAEIIINKKALLMEYTHLPEVNNLKATLFGISFALLGCESGNLIAIEDEITECVFRSPAGRIDTQLQVNKYLLGAYENSLKKFGASKELSLTSENNMEAVSA